MNDQPPHRREANLDAGKIKGESRRVALNRLRLTVAESEASGEAVPFDMDIWLEEQDRLDSAA